MTWTRIDDQFHAHPKVLAAWAQHHSSVGLYLLALSHSGAYLTDGHVSESFVRTHLPSAVERRRAVEALVSVGLWERNGNGWMIHDYLDHNESKAQVLKRREEASGARSQAARRAAQTRWRRGEDDPPADAERMRGASTRNAERINAK